VSAGQGIELSTRAASSRVRVAGNSRRAIGDLAKNVLFGALQALEALLYAAPSEQLFRLFLGSSAVEHSTVNRMVAGSNPARGASKISYFSFFGFSQLPINLVSGSGAEPRANKQNARLPHHRS
jgi:hypothetical protein